MLRQRSFLLGLCLTIAVALAGKAEAQSAKSERPSLRAGTLPADFRLDGRLDGQKWWVGVDSIPGLTVTEPEEGGVSAGRTIVRVLANSDDIVVGVRCNDPDPKGIVSYSKARDSELAEEDHVVLVFDTFLDSRSGYVFAVNPSGARFDGLVATQGASVNPEWDAIWEAKTSRDAKGWSAEIRIPIKSLNFKPDLQSWGFNVERRIQRLQETSRWAGANVDYEIYKTSRAGLLTSLPHFDLGIGLSVRPAVVGRARTPGPDLDTKYDLDLSLDVTQKLGPNFLSALTVNTDFAETDVDVRQINLTRFPVFFPEKRSFFLEGSDIFEFGLGLDEENLLPFHSRRIGLFGREEDDQASVPINVGAKIQGRTDNTNVGALVVNTRKVNHKAETPDDFSFDVPQTTMGAVRISQNIMEESSIGMLATFGDQEGRSGSWSAGVDAVLGTSRFHGDKNLLMGVWGLRDDRSDLHGDKSATGIRFEYPNDLLDMNLSTIRIGNGFSPSLGFVPRNNVQIWDFGCEINPRPSWPWIRQMFHEVSFVVFNKLDNTNWESYSATLKPFDWLLESGDRFSAGIEPEGDRPPSPFEISADVDVRAGKYEWTRYFLTAHSAEKRRLAGEITWDSGTYYQGHLHTIEGRLGIRPSNFWLLELTGERSIGRVTALVDDYEELHSTAVVPKSFKEQLYGLHLQLNFSSDLQFSSLTQYDTQSKELGANNRLRWTFQPMGELFVVYNHNLKRRPDKRWELRSNELPVKLQYAWRF